MNLPHDLSNLKGPIIGFIGAISAYKLDFDLIAQIARHKADCDFVFIGRIGEGDSSTDVSALSNLPNIHFIGPRPYSELPMYLHWFDIALLPCLINNYTTYMFPMKFFEYVAAGVPVVTTNLPSLQDYARYANISGDEDSFLSMINYILSFPKGVGPRAAIPLEELPPWCGYDERTKLMLHDLEQLAGHKAKLNQAHDDR
jgi:glycosyltransferase involved in cell wall biosynthesis